ncbi:M protein, serotype 2.1 precursor [Hirsutella rhossiliensis]|uniref:M protein, serotype 2.1 n=1 Tax=Hirsutella rhossiliensis TaxID=111463 RepID=A0A9P8MQV6_9HYPO|nr:M protein, serotype 2.1 precursor [Hirsutella rhossiliensis]KAH0959422.1 M protein, serotype 2.1 precursor [Hirsutella rhossiliensis]
MSTTASKKPPFGGTAVGRVSNSDAAAASSPSASPARNSPRSSTPTGHARARSVRGAAHVSARSAAARRDTAGESDARAEAASAVEDLQQRLEKEEKLSEQFKKQADVLQSKLDDAVKESAKLEEKAHEYEEQVEALRSEKREATRQIREMETIYEAERSAILKEKEELANKEEEMQTVIQRLKDSLAQRHNAADDDGRPSRQTANSSPSLDGSSFAPPSSLQRSDSRNSSKLILQKDKLIESLRLELAEAQIKLVESENQGGGRLQEVERLLMEARMANARLMEDNESYQLLLQEKTLKGDFGQSDFSYMNASAHQDALNALEGNAGGSSLADELSDAAAAEGDGDRRLEAEFRSMKEQNKALTMYINKIIGRLLQHQEFESILDQSGDLKPPMDINKDLPLSPGMKQPPNGPSLLQRAKSLAVGSTRTKQRPMSYVPTSGSANSAHTDPDTAPSIPIGNLGRSTSTRRSRPQSDQFTGAAGLVGQMYRGPDGTVSPPLGNSRHSPSLFGAPGLSVNPNAAARTPSGGQAPSAGNFPHSRSETSSVSGDSAEVSTSPSQSPPRSQSDKQTTFAGGKPRPLRLVQEREDAAKENKRASWYTGWSWGAKKDETQQPAGSSIPE